jgi:DNA-binding GntR family transcriptional regulator
VAAKLQALDQRTTPEEVYKVLRKAILGGDFMPGSALREAHLARDLGISRAPLREAFSRLEEEGLVTKIAFRGAFVAEVSPDTVAEIAALRVLVEPYAAECASSVLRDRLAPRLTASVRSMQKAADRGDLAASIDAHLEFHRLFYEHSGNQLLQDLWDGWESRLRLFLAVDHQSYDDLHELASAHEHLAELVLDGTDSQVRAELLHHIHRAPGESVEST